MSRVRGARIYERKPDPMSVKVIILMTEAMRTGVEQAAVRAGLPMSEWVRFLISEALERG